MKRERGYQRYPRFTKRLEATFRSGGLSYRGILSNISENGLFIRTNRGFAPGTTVDIDVVMPDNTVVALKGLVKRTIKTPITTMKNGMGIELIGEYTKYLDFVRTFAGGKADSEPETEPEIQPKVTPVPEYLIIVCPNCGVKNKVSSDKLAMVPKCGKCGKSLPVTMP
jgi:predicted RNA-binding Zn-ribbon protein involved in translation (DUF1610 family)